MYIYTYNIISYYITYICIYVPMYKIYTICIYIYKYIIYTHIHVYIYIGYIIVSE